jgi:hypothetical protein
VLARLLSDALSLYCVFLAMASPVVGIAVLAVVYFLIRYLYQTDIPKIKGLPEVPGWPMFGSLIELGDYHCKVAREWAKQYGPVFQVRLGNRVRTFLALKVTEPFFG